MYRLPTISALQRAVACPGSVALPQIPEGPQSAAAKRGTLLGAWVAASLRGWKMPDLGRYKINWNLDELRAFLGEGQILCEAAYAYRADGSTKFLGENIARAYPDERSISGAADIVVLRDDGESALVVDIKSGSFPVPSPQFNWQLSALAMVVALEHDLTSVTGAIAKMERGGTWDFGEPYTWNEAELDGIRARLNAARATWSDVDELEQSGWGAPVEPGQHCMFCKAQCQHNRRAEAA